MFITQADISPEHKKTPRAGRWRGGFGIGAWRFPTFAWRTTLSLALSGFTAEVGMGSGGSRSLWPPGKTGCSFELVGNRTRSLSGQRTLGKLLGCYMVKPHGQLVSVSFIHYWTSTPDLSTWWSSRALQGTQGPREISSWEGLPA